MAAFKDGDASAFSELVLRHERPLWNFLRRHLRDNATAEDLMQETLLRVLRGAAEWQPTAKFSTWLYTIARNLCVDHARRMIHRTTSSLDGPAASLRDGASRTRAIDNVVGGDRGGEAATFSREAAGRIEAAIAELPDEQREVFLMREVMDMPFAEIAEAVGSSVPTVKSRMRYALGRLREALSDLRDTAAGAGSAAGAEVAELP